MTGTPSVPADRGTVTTVLGPIHATELGRVDAHEHVYIAPSPLTDAHPDFTLDDEGRAIEELSAFRAGGGGTVVDMIPIGLGRNVDALRRVSEASGVHIVAATGFHRVAHYPSGHWLHRYSGDQVATLLVADVVEGIDRHDYTGPIVERSPVRAGVVKIATDYHAIPSVVTKLIEAAGTCHRLTGAPISTHSEQGTMLMEQVELLGRAGVPPAAVMVGHVDRNPDVDELGRVASTGASLIFDGIGRIKLRPDDALVRVIPALVEAGHGDRLLLGMDLARRSYWKAWGGGPGMGVLLDSFVPKLIRAGLDPAAAELMLVANPMRMLATRSAETVRSAPA